MQNLFISYSMADRPFATMLASSLVERGRRLSLSEHGMVSGQDWIGHLRTLLSGSDALILIMPTTGAPSANSTFFEAGAARALGKDVVVVVPDTDIVDRGNIPFDIASTIVLDASKKPIDSVASELISVLEH